MEAEVQNRMAVVTLKVAVYGFVEKLGRRRLMLYGLGLLS